MFGKNSTNTPPNRLPGIEPPPTPTSKETDNRNVKPSGAPNWMAGADVRAYRAGRRLARAQQYRYRPRRRRVIDMDRQKTALVVWALKNEYGRVKISGTTAVNPTGLYTTILSHTIQQLENFSATARSNFVMIVDEHSARKQLLITSAKTMYGANPARHMLSPPFEVESYINQNIQCADWVAAIVSRLWALIRPFPISILTMKSSIHISGKEFNR